MFVIIHFSIQQQNLLFFRLTYPPPTLPSTLSSAAQSLPLGCPSHKDSHTTHTRHKGNAFQLPRSCSVTQLEQITRWRDLSITQKLRNRFFVAATEIWAATRSSTSNQPYKKIFSTPCSLRCWRRSKRGCRAFYAVLLFSLPTAHATA